MHPKKRKSDLPTVISPSHSLDSVDNSLPGALTPPQNWIDEVKQNVRSSWDMTSKDKVLDTDWLSHCLESLLSQEIVEKYGFSTQQTATKVVLRDLIFTRKLKEVCMKYPLVHGLRTLREEIVFTAQPKIHSHSQMFRYGRSIFCQPHRPNFSDIFDLWLHRFVRSPCNIP